VLYKKLFEELLERTPSISHGAIRTEYEVMVLLGKEEEEEEEEEEELYEDFLERTPSL